MTDKRAGQRGETARKRPYINKQRCCFTVSACCFTHYKGRSGALFGEVKQQKVFHPDKSAGQGGCFTMPIKGGKGETPFPSQATFRLW
jgi:hypothetical protein